MGLEIYAPLILCSLTFHAVVVYAHNDFADETSQPKGNNLPWFTFDINKLVNRKFRYCECSFIVSP